MSSATKTRARPTRAESERSAKPLLGDDHPLNDIMGTYEGPVWEEILKNIKRNRKRQDKEYFAAQED